MALFRSVFLLTCCLLVAVGPLNFLQVVAWGNMIHDYSGDRSLVEATEMTFSGEYPCEMCRRIAEARAEASHGDQTPLSPAKEGQASRLVFNFHEKRFEPSLFWIKPVILEGAEKVFLSPGSHHERIPTPPPQFASC